MQQVNRYYKSAKISAAKFRYLLRLFALDLTASDTARLTGLSVRSVNTIYLRLRRRLQAECRVPVELAGAVELDECYFGPRRVRGKRGREQGAKPWSLACSNGAVRCTRKLSQTVRKRPCRPLFGVKWTFRRWSIPMAGAATMGWWTWAMTATSGSITAKMSSSRAQPTSTASSRFGGFAKARLQQFRGLRQELFLLHLKECEFRFNHRQQDLYKSLLKLLRQQPL